MFWARDISRVTRKHPPGPMEDTTHISLIQDHTYQYTIPSVLCIHLTAFARTSSVPPDLGKVLLVLKVPISYLCIQSICERSNPHHTVPRPQLLMPQASALVRLARQNKSTAPSASHSNKNGNFHHNHSVIYAQHEDA